MILSLERKTAPKPQYGLLTAEPSARTADVEIFPFGPVSSMGMMHSSNSLITVRNDYAVAV